MSKLKKLVIEAMTKYKKPTKKSCSCGCNTCDTDKAKPMSLNENIASKEILSEGLKYHMDKKQPLTENVYRAGSERYFDLWAEARALYSRGILEINNQDDIEILTETHLGHFGILEDGTKVPLDFIMEEEQEETTEFNINKVWDFIESKPFYNKDYMPKFNTAEEIYDEFGPKEMELYNNFEWKNTYGDKLHPRELAARQRQANYNALAGIKELKENTDEVVTLLNNPKLDKDVKSMLFKAYKDGKLTSQSVQNIVNKLLKENKSNPTGKTLNMDDYDMLVGLVKNNIQEEKKTPPIGKPKRGGSKKFYVYVRDKGKIKKVSFGDTSGLSAKINNPEARRAFAKRHDCANKKDRTKASYWSCRLPRYAKLLGLKSNFSGFW